MKKEGLIEYLVTMNYGENIEIIMKDRYDNFILGTIISKVKWFDTPVLIIGGYDDELIASSNLSEDDETEIIKETINNYIGELDVEIEIEKRGIVKIEFK